MRKWIIKRKILSIILLALIPIIFILIGVGVIVFPNCVYSKYFEFNQTDFERVVEYVRLNADGGIKLRNEFENGSISDKQVERSIQKILNSVLFEDIVGYSDNSTTTVRITINNFFEAVNTPLEVVYKESDVSNSYSYSNKYCYITTYTKISGDWYIYSYYIRENGG